MNKNVYDYIQKIKANLTPDLLKKEYQKDYDVANPSYGFCYIASEALYHFLNDPDTYGVARGRDENGIMHWWLVNKETDQIIDPTADQYYSQDMIPPYENGRMGTFLSKEPSNRTKVLMKRIDETS